MQHRARLQHGRAGQQKGIGTTPSAQNLDIHLAQTDRLTQLDFQRQNGVILITTDTQLVAGVIIAKGLGGQRCLLIDMPKLAFQRLRTVAFNNADIGFYVLAHRFLCRHHRDLQTGLRARSNQQQTDQNYCAPHELLPGKISRRMLTRSHWHRRAQGQAFAVLLPLSVARKSLKNGPNHEDRIL